MMQVGMTRETRYLEFVGGPLDGCRDIDTPVGCYQYVYPEVAAAVTGAPGEAVLPHRAAPATLHCYRLVRWAGRPVWLYDGC